MKIKTTLLLFVIALSGITGYAASTPREALIASRKADLAKARTPEDSLEILFDLFDLRPYMQPGQEIAGQIYNLGARLKRPEVQLDLLRDLAAVYIENDTAMRMIVKAARSFPESDEQRETLTYCRVMESETGARANALLNLQEDQAARLIKEMSDSLAYNSQNINDRILTMFTVVRYLRKNSPGVLMENLLSTLNKSMEKLPLKLYDLRKEYFDESASAFTHLNMPMRAVQTNRELLRLLNENEAQMRSSGRKYYTDDFYIYRCYRRMLTNFKVLNNEEIESIYKKIKSLAAVNLDVAADMEENGRAEINYAVAHKNWAKALPLLQKYLDEPSNVEMRRFFLKYLLQGALATNNNELYTEAATEYIAELENMLEQRYDERTHELQIMTEMNNAGERARELQNLQEQSKIENQRKWVLAAFIIIPLLLLLIGGLFFVIHRTRKYKARLEESVNELKKERDNVLNTQRELITARNRAQVANRQKTEFINNMTHEVRTPLTAIADYSRLITDCIADDKRTYLDNYVKLIEFNNELVETIVNDVLEISEIDNHRLKVNLKPEPIKVICEIAMENAAQYLHPGVEMVFANRNSEDVTVTTDRRRVEQVLINLLNNAAKFTKQGRVTLSYKVVGNMLEFEVTDTGSGIPPEKAGLVFERFEKLDSSTQGAGLGLPIARLLAGLLKGSLKLDTSYTGGARFVFTIPLK